MVLSRDPLLRLRIKSGPKRCPAHYCSPYATNGFFSLVTVSLG